MADLRWFLVLLFGSSFSPIVVRTDSVVGDFLIQQEQTGAYLEPASRHPNLVRRPSRKWRLIEAVKQQFVLQDANTGFVLTRVPYQDTAVDIRPRFIRDDVRQRWILGKNGAIITATRPHYVLDASPLGVTLSHWTGNPNQIFQFIKDEVLPPSIEEQPMIIPEHTLPTIILEPRSKRKPRPTKKPKRKSKPKKKPKRKHKSTKKPKRKPKTTKKPKRKPKPTSSWKPRPRPPTTWKPRPRPPNIWKPRPRPTPMPPQLKPLSAPMPPQSIPNSLLAPMPPHCKPNALPAPMPPQPRPKPLPLPTPSHCEPNALPAPMPPQSRPNPLSAPFPMHMPSLYDDDDDDY